MRDGARPTAGREAHEAWKEERSPSTRMNMAELFARLKTFDNERDRFRDQISWADKA